MAIRKLPVIQEPTGEDAEAAARPAWHWVLIGAALLITIWMPFVVVALAIARKIASGGAPGAIVAGLLAAATFSLASLAAGYLVARFGQRTQPRHAVFAGLLAATAIWLLVVLAGAFPTALEAGKALGHLSALAAGFCSLGSRLARPGRRAKRS